MRAGWTVKIADIDTMQGTSTKWKLRRDAAQLQTEIPVEKFATVERALREADKFDLVIFDGPAHAKKGGLTMGKKSTIILMPTCYGLDDLEARIEAAYELEEKGSTRPVSGVVSQLVAVVTPLVLGKGWVVETQPEPEDHYDDRGRDRLSTLLEKGSDATFLREMIGFAAERLMALETEPLCGAAPGERSAE